MNLEVLDSSQPQPSWPRDPGKPEEITQRRNLSPGLAAFPDDEVGEEDDEPPGSSRKVATIERHGQASAIIIDSIDKYQVCRSPEESESGSDISMQPNREGSPPLITPPESPGSVADIGQLSLQSVSPDNRAHNARGRGSTPGLHAASSKRAASSEHPPRDNPPSLRPKPATRRYGQNSAQGPSKSRLEPKQSGSRSKVTLPRNHLSSRERMRPVAHVEVVEPDPPRPSFDVFHHAPKIRQPIPRDSGYDTMSSRQNTLQQPLPILSDPKVGVAPSHPVTRVKEESSGVTTRLAGPVPVLVNSRFPKLIMQPESSPISQDQLAAEVKGIYGGLVMVEAKCINIDAAQAANPESELGKEQWQALIALHRTLLYEHHDFLMATQHPSATTALSGLAQKYSMPARMWRHGIHAFLEVLRHRRPQSQDYMLSFIYLAYQMMALLFETVPAFTDTWIECLGDLARYRMAIEEEKEAHTIWGGVAARWYNLASDRHPAIGRLYHHLGILERPSLRKMFLYAKSLSCVIPFPNARDSLATLCGPIIQENERTNNGMVPAEATIVSYHAYLFSAPDTVVLNGLSSEILSQLDNFASPKVRDIGVPLLVTNIAALFELGSPSNQLWACFNQSINASIQASRPSAAAFPALSKADASQADPWPVEGTSARDYVYDFCGSCFQHIMHRGKDRQSLRDVLPAVHTTLVWLSSLYTTQSNVNELDNTVCSLIDRFSWVELCSFLNTLLQYEPIDARTFTWAADSIFPGSDAMDDIKPRPLSEDYLIRGLIWCHSYFPEQWFDCQAEDDGRFFETTAMHKARVERVHWLGLSLAHRSEYFSFDKAGQRFVPSATLDGPESTVMEMASQSFEPTNGDECSTKPKRSSSPKSRSSPTPSMQSDCEGFTWINKPKLETSYAKVASAGYHEPTIADYDCDMA